MIPDVSIPADWVRVLRQVQTVFPGAMIVGGPLRDLVLGHPVNDLDVFVPVRRGLRVVDALPAIEAALGGRAEVKHIETDPLAPWPLLWVVCVRGALPIPVDVVALAVERPEEVLLYQCVGLGRIAFDGDQLLITEDFLRDVHQHTITVYKGRSALHVDKIMHRFPDYQVQVAFP